MNGNRRAPPADRAQAPAWKRTARWLDRELFHGRLRDWVFAHASLGARWGDFLATVEKVHAGAVVLDLGAGEADMGRRIPHARYIALDRAIGSAHWDYGKLDVVGDAHALPLRDQTCDLIICKQVLEHLPEPLQAMKEMRRVLKPGGRLLLSTNQQWPQHQQPHDFFRFTSFGLRYCSEKAGLAVQELSPMGGVFSVFHFQFSQTLMPHLWAKSDRGRRLVRTLLLPMRWLLRATMPLVTWLDKRDQTKDNTLGWYLVAQRPSDESPRPLGAGRKL